jgi:DNA-binding PadR family transcriptional regulator
MSGYALVKTIEERTGWKPSYGSMYPALETLHQKGEVHISEEGRSKIYSLTKKGKQSAQHAGDTKVQAIDKMIEQMRIIHEVGEDDLSEQIAIMQELKTPGNNPFGTLEKDMVSLKKQLLRLWKQELLGAHKKDIKHILAQATKQLKQLQ